MSDYIKREDILDFLSGIYDCNDMVFEDDVCGSGADCSTCRWRDTRDFIREKISRFPAADAVDGIDFRDCRNELCLRCGDYKQKRPQKCSQRRRLTKRYVVTSLLDCKTGRQIRSRRKSA